MKSPSQPAPSARPSVLNPSAAALGQFNAILSGTSSRYFTPDFAGPLSIKTVISGSAAWETPGRRYVVHENTYLVLNDRQNYTLTIDSHEKTTTFCVFFECGFVEQVHDSMTRAPASLLDDPTTKSFGRLEFRERLEAQPSPVLTATRALHASLSQGRTSRTGTEESFLTLAEALLVQHTDSQALASHIVASRSTTREELYRRVLRGRDFLLSSLDQRVSLAAAARAACLSQYHFLRAFRDAFGSTPHQYLTHQRLARARLLLARGNRSVTEVCLESGFESLGSFSSLFRRHFGLSPQQIQREPHVHVPAD